MASSKNNVVRGSDGIFSAAAGFDWWYATTHGPGNSGRGGRVGPWPGWTWGGHNAFIAGLPGSTGVPSFLPEKKTTFPGGTGLAGVKLQASSGCRYSCFADQRRANSAGFRGRAFQRHIRHFFSSCPRA